MRALSVVVFLLVCLLFPSPHNALAVTYTIPDTTLVLEGHSRSNAITSWMDVIGDPDVFGVYGINVNQSQGALTFDVFTNFPGYHTFTTTFDNTPYHFYLSDFAIDVNGDGTYEYGVVLRDHSLWDQGVAPIANSLPVGLYSVSQWDTSTHFFEEPTATNYGDINSGGIGYGEYYWDGTQALAPIVAIANGSWLADVSVVSNILSGQEAKYAWSFSFAADLLPGLGSQTKVFWAGDNSASDAILGAPIPEPSTIILLGAGLIGLLALRRKSRD